MKPITKALVGTVAAGAIAAAVASPAHAQYRDRDRDDDGISAGEVIAGAVILGGLAAVIASADNDRDRDYRYRDRHDRRGYNRYNSRAAVDQCVRTAEREAQRYTGSRAEVYEIRDIDRERNGYEVKGRIAVQDRRYRGGWGEYRRNYRNSGWDEGRYTCRVRNGRVVDLDYSGIRGL